MSVIWKLVYVSYLVAYPGLFQEERWDHLRDTLKEFKTWTSNEANVEFGRITKRPWIGTVEDNKRKHYLEHTQAAA